MSGDASGPDEKAPPVGETAPTFRCPSCGAPASAEARACRHCGSLLATCRCLTCFALSPREAERCLRCGALLPREALAAERAGACPDCRLDLVSRAFGPVGYAECPRCAGIFLGSAAFDAVTRDADTRAKVRLAEPPSSGAAASASPRVRYRPCPVCRTLMNRQNYAGGSGVVVDSCRAHGTWFDRGELTAIVEFLEKGGWDRLKRRERERLEEEVRSLERARELRRATEMPASAYDREVQGLSALGGLLGLLGRLLR